MEKAAQQRLAAEVAELLTRQGLTLSVAESCTGGLLSSYITAVPGASNFYRGGACTYCDEIKQRILGVRPETLKQYTAVSRQTAAEMAEGCARVFGTDLAVSITGYAGPEGGEDGTPVGTIYVGLCCRGAVRVEHLHEPSDRETARERACEMAFHMILEQQNSVERKK